MGIWVHAVQVLPNSRYADDLSEDTAISCRRAVYGDRTMALPISGRVRQQLSWPILRNLSQAIGVPGLLAAEIWVDDLNQLPSDINTIRNLRRLVNARMHHIQPEARQAPANRHSRS